MKQINSTLKQIYLQSPIINFVFILWLVFSSIGLKLAENDYQKSGATFAFYIIFTLIIGNLLGRNIFKIKQTYLWHINKSYRQTLEQVVLIMPLLITVIPLLMVVNQSPLKLLIVLLGLVMLYTQIITFRNPHSTSQFILIISPLLISVLGDLDSNKITLIILFYTIYIFMQLSVYFENRKHQESNKLKLKTHALKSKLIQHFKILQPNFKNKNMNVILSSTGTIFPYMAIFTSVGLITYYVILIVTHTRELKGSMIVTLMLMLNFILISELRMLITQSQKMAHLYCGKNHEGIKNELVKIMDKIIIYNNLAFITIVLVASYLFGLPFNKMLLVSEMFISMLLFYNSYLLLMVINANIVEFMIINLLIYGFMSFIVYIYLHYNLNAITSWSHALSLLVIMSGLRWLSLKVFMKSSFENLVKLKK